MQITVEYALTNHCIQYKDMIVLQQKTADLRNTDIFYLEVKNVGERKKFGFRIIVANFSFWTLLHFGH